MTNFPSEFSSNLNSYKQVITNTRFIALLLMLAILIISLLCSSSMNRECFLWINTSVPQDIPDVLLPIWDDTMVSLTYLGDLHVILWIILLINLSWWIAAGKKVPEELFMYLVVFAAVMILGVFALQGLKHIFDAPRPASVLPIDSLRILDRTLYKHSFPSGHTTTAFAGIMTFIPIIPAAWRKRTLALAVIIGISRIGVGAHWPIDVVSGAFLGIITGIAGWRITLYIQKMKSTGSIFWNKVYRGLAMTGMLLLTVNAVYSPFYHKKHLILQFALIAICLCVALMFGNFKRSNTEEAA